MISEHELYAPLLAAAVGAVFSLICVFITAYQNHREQRTQRQHAAHIFLDIETLGIKPTAPVLVIAAYVVDSLGNKIDAACWYVHPKSAKQYGEPEQATEQWWTEQSERARSMAFREGPRLELPDALEDLTAFIKPLAKQYGDQCFVWGNAPTFDCTILRHAYEAVGLDLPWEFWQERDVRTVAWLGELTGHDAKKLTDFIGEPHVALDDARHQARYTIEILNKLGIR